MADSKNTPRCASCGGPATHKDRAPFAGIALYLCGGCLPMPKPAAEGGPNGYTDAPQPIGMERGQ